jgi:predicted enzyme related to lactoylglutathione lyase
MIKISTTQVWVHDQDEALAFYTDKLGWDVRMDVTVAELGNFRWLSVGPTEQPEISVDAETAKQIEELMTKGAAGALFLTTDDIHGAVAELKGRGVEFTEEPTEYPYGIDSSFRDPSGNNFRLAQLTPGFGG